MLQTGKSWVCLFWICNGFYIEVHSTLNLYSNIINYVRIMHAVQVTQSKMFDISNTDTQKYLLLIRDNYYCKHSEKGKIKWKLWMQILLSDKSKITEKCQTICQSY